MGSGFIKKEGYRLSVTYNIYRDGVKITSKIEAKEYTDTGLEPDTEYMYQVSAENSAGESTLSDPITVKTEPIPEPENPENPVEP